MARRALDYLVGFNISPILWTKLPGSKSAGRVQSVALRLLTEREHEIEQFKPEEYWTLKVSFNNKDSKVLNSNIVLLNNKKIDKFSFKSKGDINNAIEEVKKKKLFNYRNCIKNIYKKSIGSIHYLDTSTNFIE